MTRDVVDRMAEDPMVNYSPPRELNKMPKMRMRNARGQYQSIDFTARSGSVGQSLNSSQNFYGQQNNAGGAGTTLTKAENRLRIIEQISKFREDKIKNEFIKLENELKLEEEKNKKL